MKPMRMCLCCRNRFEKDKLIKIIKNKQGQILVDLEKKLDGRGAYICDSEDCCKKLIKQKMLNKVFKCQIEQKVYDDVLIALGNKLKEI